VALGYQGFGNVGDEAILAGIEELLSGSRVQVATVIGGAQPIAAYALARRIETHRMRPNLAATRAIRGSGVVLVSGGGLLNDHWSTVVPTYLAWTVLARLVGARIAWIGVGVGPLRRPISRRLAGWALRLAACITVRDPESAALVASIAPGVKVTVVPDPALLISPPEPRQRSGIGFVVRHTTPGRVSEGATMANALADAAARFAPRSVRLITFGGRRDRAFAGEVRERAAWAGITLSIEELDPDPHRAIEVMAGLESVVSVRLHGLILAAVAGTPAVPVAYDQKVLSTARLLGIEHLCQPISGLTGQGIAAALSEAQSSATQDAVAQRLDELRSGGPALRSLIEKAVA